MFWKSWRDKNVLFVQDLLNNQGNYLSPQEFSNKYNIKVNFLQYYQIITAIPASLKSYAFTHLDLGKLNSISENVDFQISKDVSLNLKKTSCKQFYKLFTENISIEPTAVTTWGKHCTNKELTRFGITDCTMCVMCGENDSIEHTFFECCSFLNLCDESIQWFNISYKTNIKLTPLQVFLNLPTPAFNLSNKQTKDLCLLIYVKQYHYGCKSMQKKTDTSEFISKFIMQLEIEV